MSWLRTLVNIKELTPEIYSNQGVGSGYFFRIMELAPDIYANQYVDPVISKSVKVTVPASEKILSHDLQTGREAW